MVPACCTLRESQPEVLIYGRRGLRDSQPALTTGCQAARWTVCRKARRPLHQLFSESFYCNTSGFLVQEAQSQEPRAHIKFNHIEIVLPSWLERSSWSPDMHFLRKANKITLFVFKKSCNFSAWIMIFLWEAELFGKETVILSSTGQPIAVLWNTLAETAPLLYGNREIWLLREPWIILQLSVCNGDCKNAFDVRILVSDKAGTSTDLRSLCALRNSQCTAINKVHWERGSGHHLKPLANR